MKTHTHTHTYIYIYIYIYMQVYACAHTYKLNQHFPVNIGYTFIKHYL